MISDERDADAARSFQIEREHLAGPIFIKHPTYKQVWNHHQHCRRQIDASPGILATTRLVVVFDLVLLNSAYYGGMIQSLTINFSR